MSGGSAFVILSGKYVGAELVAEFGLLPPSLLPNGGRPLYEAQIDVAAALGAAVVLVLPPDFALPAFDAQRLADRAVTIVYAPPASCIVESLAVGLAAAAPCDELYLLFGDTLVPEGQVWPVDGFAAGTTDHVAFWAEYEESASGCKFRETAPGRAGSATVLAGFFHIGDPTLLARSGEGVRDLTELLNRYGDTRPLVPVALPNWLDFGHLFTYHQSRCRQLLARSFNSVTSDGVSVVKSGTPARKIFAEAQWYASLPPRLLPYAPQYMGLTDTMPVAYELEYLYLPLISELYGFARLPVTTWRTMLDSCQAFLETMQGIRPAAHDVPVGFAPLFFDDMVHGKTQDRLADFAQSRGLDMDRGWVFDRIAFPSLNDLVDRLTGMIRPTADEDIGVWHGDFHFGNIFYDFRSRKVRVVDPRGLLSNGMLTLHGDARYDIAKLGHSVFGLYDALIADRFDLSYDGSYEIALNFGHDPVRDAVIAGYAERRIGRYATADREAIAMVALLFLSMLPLHAQDGRRQIAILGNAMRLARLAEAAS